MRYLASPAQLRASLLRWSLFTVPLVLGLGFLSGRVAGSGPANAWFSALVKPGLYPPPATFGIVWSILYVMIGVSLAMVLSARGAPGRGIALAVFVVQLLLNLAWSPVFFMAHQPRAALVVLLVLVVAVMGTVALFWRIRTFAGALLLPYLAWVLFASVLNWQIAALNPDAENIEASGAAVRLQL